MIGTCQFCRAMVIGPDARHADTPEAAAKMQSMAYLKLSLLVSAHMMEHHAQDVGKEVQAAMARAGAAVAMRFVHSTDAALDAERDRAGRELMAQFEPKPPGPLLSLAA